MAEVNLRDPHDEFATHRQLGEAMQSVKSDCEDTYVSRINAKKVCIIWAIIIFMLTSIFVYQCMLLHKAVQDLEVSIERLDESIQEFDACIDEMETRMDKIEDEIEDLQIIVRAVDIYYYQQTEASKERLLEIEYEMGWITNEDIKALGIPYQPVKGPEYGQSYLEDLTPTDLPSMNN